MPLRQSARGGLPKDGKYHRVQPIKVKSDIEAILDILEKVQTRIEELRSTVLQQQAMINATLLCLRDRTQCDPKELEKLFQYYQQVVHQQLLKINTESAVFPESLQFSNRPSPARTAKKNKQPAEPETIGQ
jgi:hypothetical protein